MTELAWRQITGKGLSSGGFGIDIMLIGTGYRCELQNNTLYFKLGFNHSVVVNFPEGIHIVL